MTGATASVATVAFSRSELSAILSQRRSNPSSASPATRVHTQVSGSSAVRIKAPETTSRKPQACNS